MKASRVLFLALSLVVATSLALPTAAGAYREPPPPSPDSQMLRSLSGQLAAAGSAREAMWRGLPAGLREAVVAFQRVSYIGESTIIEPARGGPAGLVSRAAAGCKSVTKSRSAYNVFGQVLWTYYQKIDWCYNGTKITSKTRIRWGDLPWYSLWQFIGHMDSVQSGGVGQWSYRAWTQGEFRFSLVGYPVQHAYPWVDMTVYGNGTSKGSSGG